MTNPYQSLIAELEQKITDNQRLLSDPELSILAQQEIATLTEQKKLLEKTANDYESAVAADQVNKPGESPTNCIFEFRPGAGGDEAKIWADDLMRMYMRFADLLKLKIEMIDDSVVKFSGRVQWPTEWQEKMAQNFPDQPQLLQNLIRPYTLFRSETGVHRVQRVPETEAQGRIHTSTASIAVLPEIHPQAFDIRDEDLEWQFMRAGGAGGQNVNKVNSAVRLTHAPSGIVVTCRQEKKQEQNRKIALELLRAQLWEIEEEKRLSEIGDARSAIGRNQRAEKIRTYNFPQNRVTDHRIQESWYNLESILEGNLFEVISTVHAKMIDPSGQE